MLLQDLNSVSALDRLVFSLEGPGYQFIPAPMMLGLLGGRQALPDWGAFVASWDELSLDTYMADRGRYRRRRHAIYRSDGGKLRRAAHRAHFQTTDYNPLNGGVERWYVPIPGDVAEGASLQAILANCQRVFGRARPSVKRWNVEVHQFRIEASAGQVGQPTPEGMHRDGVDYVLVLLIARHNVASGTTIIGSPDGLAQGSFTLTSPFDAMMLDDHRVFHGVTAIEPLDVTRVAKRDVLVVTFKAVDVKAVA
jgi:hypothetical protein